MRWRHKLFLMHGAILTVCFIFFMIIKSRVYAPTLFNALVTIDWIIGMMLSYVIVMWYSGKLEKVSSKAKQLAGEPNAFESGNKKDELFNLSQSLDELSSQLSLGEEVRNRLVADVAHELRTPLTILRGQIEMLTEGSQPLRNESLLPLLDEITRMSKLIQDLQQLNLAESGRLRLERQWLSFPNLVEEVIAVLEPAAEDKGVQLLYRGHAYEEVYCDRQRMKQVMINLIGNAIRYCNNGGTVTCNLIQLEGKIVIDVTDDGSGIPPESIPYLFKRFYRVDESRNRQLGGTGLGLAIVKEFVEAHGGTITVKSMQGKGSTFSMMIPSFPES